MGKSNSFGVCVITASLETVGGRVRSNRSRVRSARRRTERSALYARASREISSVRRHSWRALRRSFHEANCKSEWCRSGRVVVEHIPNLNIRQT